MFKLVPEEGPIKAYVNRISARPALAKVQADDATLAAEHEATVKA